jgi:hypothetical protein
LSAASTLDEEVETLNELVLIALRATSRLVDEVDRLIDEP